MATNQFQGYRYHRTNHERLCGNVAFMSADLRVWGVVMGIRLMAGQTRQQRGNADGRLAMGSVWPAKEDDVLAWIVTKGCSRKEASALWKAVKNTGAIEVMKRSRTVRVADWAKEQEEPSTDNARHKRDSRERQAISEALVKLEGWYGKTMPQQELVGIVSVLLRKGLGVSGRIVERMVDRDLISRDEQGNVTVPEKPRFIRPASPSPPAPTDSDNLSTDNADMSGRNPDMSADIDSRQKRRLISLSTRQLPTAGGEGEAGKLHALLHENPVKAACFVTESFTTSNQRIFGAKLRDLKARSNGQGEKIFRRCVEILAAELRAGEHQTIKAAGDLPAFLTSKLKKKLG